MAEGYLRAFAGDRATIYSAGIETHEQIGGELSGLNYIEAATGRAGSEPKPGRTRRVRDKDNAVR